MNELNQINEGFELINRTDKNRHGYLNVYEQYFQPLKEKEISLLEIGIWSGASIRIWEKFFTRALIYGIEKDPAVLDHKFSRAKIDIVDQSDKIQLENYSKDKNFDIIIDDGSHFPLDQILSFQILFEKLNSGGLYIIEDLHVAYQEIFRNYKGLNVSFLSNLLHYLNFCGKVHFLAEPEKEKHKFVEYDGRFEFMHFYPGLCIIKKTK